MNNAGRYRKLYPRIWCDPGFRGMRESARLLALYMLTGPQSNRAGIFRFSIATAADDLNLGVETLRRGLVDVSAAFGWLVDLDARVAYIPSWWAWNPPENQNVLAGNLKDLHEVPPCALTEAFANNLATLQPTFHETFRQGIAKRLRQPSSIQKQKQDQKHTTRAARIDGRGIDVVAAQERLA